MRNTFKRFLLSIVTALLLAAPLMAYLAPGRYAEIRSGHAFPYPAGFMR